MSQSIYKKHFKQRAGELLSILLGENIPIRRASFQLALTSKSPKSIILVVLNDGEPKISITKHVRVDSTQADISFHSYENNKVLILNSFNRIDVSVPEDTEFILNVFLADDLIY